MTAAEDLHRRQETETALKRLAEGRQYTRKGLFSRVERWQDSLLKRMTNSGVASVENRGRGKPALYQVADNEKLQGILSDEDQLLQMVFPSYKPAGALDELTPMLPNLNPNPTEPLTEEELDQAVLHRSDPVPTIESLQGALESSGAMSPEILLKLLLGMIELLNSHTDQLNQLTSKLDELDNKVSRLLKELTG